MFRFVTGELRSSILSVFSQNESVVAILCSVLTIKLTAEIPVRRELSCIHRVCFSTLIPSWKK